VDVLAAVPVAALAIYLASLGQKAEARAKSTDTVNKVPPFTTQPVLEGVFRATAAQNAQSGQRAIKPKLSGVS
jgi:hypothetical protein